jgi:hypothetical protein
MATKAELDHQSKLECAYNSLEKFNAYLAPSLEEIEKLSKYSEVAALAATEALNQEQMKLKSEIFDLENK